jgi:cytochrome c-type biogenesis protein CcmH
MIALFLIALLQVKVPDAQQFVGPPRGTPITGAVLDQKTNEVASLLRCPVCQGMSVADSPSTVALDMKQQVRELLAAGFTQEQILAYFERSYGQFVLLKPKTPVVWMLPVIALLIGVGVLVFKFRKLETAPVEENAAPAAPPADPYLDRVRQLVDGK